MKKHLLSSPMRVFSLLIIALVLTIGLWIGCGEQATLPTAQEESQKTVILSAKNPQVRAVMSIQDRHTNELMSKPGVVGTATGLTDDGKPAIIVYVKNDILAKQAAITSIIENVPVVIQVTGEFKALKGGPPGGPPGGGGPDPTARQPRPVPIGVSTGHPAITAGTIGCRVKNAAGQVFALSNNHVYAATNFLDCTPNAPLWNCALGDPVIQPGTFDGGITPDDDIGNVVDFEPIDFSVDANGNPIGNNVIDAAVASSSTSLLGNATLSDGYGTPLSTTVSAALNMKVMKYGRTTGLTTGRVQGINATVNVNYGSPGVARFINQIVIGGGGFSQGGDSGSLIIRNDGNKKSPIAGPAVGLLFAGGGGSTIANPIDAVLARFGVTIDGQ